MARVHTQQIKRVVTGMTVGAISAYDQRQWEDWQDALDEIDQQFQIPFSAEVRSKLVTASVELEFDAGFVVEPLRNSPYSTPLFTFGIENVSGPPALIVAEVSEWRGAANGLVTGATITVSACIPGATVVRKIERVLHLNFQGYGADLGTDLNEDTEEDDEVT